MILKFLYLIVAPLFNFLYHSVLNIKDDEAGMGAISTLLIAGIIFLISLIIFIVVNVKYNKTKKASLFFIAVNSIFILYLILAALPNVSGCGSNDMGGKNYCIKSYAYDRNNVKLCEKLNDNYLEKSRCFEDLADDIKSCDHIDEGFTRSFCLKALAIYKSDLATCEKINIQLEKDWCFSGFAIKEYKPELCKQIETIWPQNQCYIKTARSKNELENCKKIEKEDDMYRCYRNIAKETKDKSICNLVFNTKSNDHKKYCLRGV